MELEYQIKGLIQIKRHLAGEQKTVISMRDQAQKQVKFHQATIDRQMSYMATIQQVLLELIPKLPPAGRKKYTAIISDNIRKKCTICGNIVVWDEHTSQFFCKDCREWVQGGISR